MEDNTSKAYAGAESLLNPMTPGAGSALFVINLCASIAPVDARGKNLPGLENYRLYQVTRIEDGRTRHRLRLGFFTSESHAESVLTVVRQQYPTAFTTCLSEEDRRFARGYLPQAAATAKPQVAVVANPKSTPSAPQKPTPKATAASKPAVSHSQAPSAPGAKSAASVAGSKPAAPAAAPRSVQPAAAADVIEVTWEPESRGERKPLNVAPSPPPASHAAGSIAGPAKQPTSKPAAPKTPASTPSKVDPAASMRVKALDLSFSDPPPPPRKASAPSNEPFHVGKGVEIGELQISLEADAPPKRLQAAAVTGKAPLKNAGSPAVDKTSAKIAAPKPTAATKAPTLTSSRLPDLDSTQTIRALTSAELNDEAQEKWFAIQLAASEQPVNLDTMPHLDIFEAYRLYSVATAGSGRIVHSLRLGFFKEAVSAEAVAGYLKTFFSSPTVLRISVAEHARFKDPPAAPKTPAAAARGPAKLVELNDARAVRPVIPTVTMEVPAPHADASPSFKGASGSQKAFTPTLKPAAKTASVATKRAEPVSRKTGTTGKYKAPPLKKSLAEQLLDEAREVELSESGIRKLPKNDSLLSKLVGKLSK